MLPTEYEKNQEDEEVDSIVREWDMNEITHFNNLPLTGMSTKQKEIIQGLVNKLDRRTLHNPEALNNITAEINLLIKDEGSALYKESFMGNLLTRIGLKAKSKAPEIMQDISEQLTRIQSHIENKSLPPLAIAKECVDECKKNLFLANVNKKQREAIQVVLNKLHSKALSNPKAINDIIFDIGILIHAEGSPLHSRNMFGIKQTNTEAVRLMRKLQEELRPLKMELEKQAPKGSIPSTSTLITPANEIKSDRETREKVIARVNANQISPRKETLADITQDQPPVEKEMVADKTKSRARTFVDTSTSRLASSTSAITQTLKRLPITKQRRQTSAITASTAEEKIQETSSSLLEVGRLINASPPTAKVEEKITNTPTLPPRRP
jgi:hypothetical protein